MEPEKRTRNACARCRRQRLKCDKQRPCPLCVRAKVECTQATERTRRSNRIHPTTTTRRSANGAGAPRGDASRPPDPGSQGVSPNRTVPSDDTALSGYDGSSTRVHQPSSARAASASVEHGEEAYQHERERASTIRVVEKIFQKYRSSGLSRIPQTDAIPDATPSSRGPATSSVDERLVPLTELIGIDLPEPNVCTALIDSFVDSMHWYLPVFHVSTMRARLDSILRTRSAPVRSRPFLLLVLAVLVMGVTWISDEASEAECRGVDLDELRKNLLGAAERWFLPSMETITVESIAFSLLMASLYLFNRQTKVAFVTMGTTVRAAQFIGLHQESSWVNISDVERDLRRRVWWSVVVGAGFLSMAYGSPPLISEHNSSVGQPGDWDDDSQKCPGFHTLELRDDGKFWPVTMGSYQRYKAKLYTMVSSIMRDVYFNRGVSTRELVRRVENYHKQLIEWERSVPPELRVESHADVSFEGRDGAVRRIFCRQAVTLRIIYDNGCLLLFRPFISLDKDGGRAATGPNDTNPDSVPRRFLNIARNQVWTSAMRASFIGQHPEALTLVYNSPASTHVGIHVFSAGVTLGILALSAPLSKLGRECKLGIARLIQVASVAMGTMPVWKQMTDVLTSLVHVVAAEETDSLIRGETGGGPYEEVPEVAEFGSPPNLYTLQEPETTQWERGPPRQEHQPQTPVLQESVRGGFERTSSTDVLSSLPTSFPRYDTPQSSAGMAQAASEDSPSFWEIPHMQWGSDRSADVGQIWMWDDAFSYL